MERNKNQGFTLIELLVVVSIIGLLASILLVSLHEARAKADDARMVEDFHSLKNALTLYYQDHGSYPHITAHSYDDSWNSVIGAALQPYLDRMPKPISNSVFYWYTSASPGNSCIIGGTTTELLIQNGYYIYGVPELFNEPFLNQDGGINPILYEVYDGDNVQDEFPGYCASH
jgi:prepilin-type N-terminal cleavage/methylation domain-containing protein